MRNPPRDILPDSTLALAWGGYEFISKRRQRYGSDAFACRILMRKAICIGGPDAAPAFYDTNLFRRAGVAPSRVKRTLLGENGIHGLDGQRHLHRKAMFLEILGSHQVAPFRRILLQQWKKRANTWVGQSDVTLFSELEQLLFGAMCEWAGIPIDNAQVKPRAEDLTAMVDAFGGILWRNWRGRFARRRSERWMAAVLDGARNGSIETRHGSALERIAAFRDVDGHELPKQTAVVELLNVVRPIMAVPYFAELAVVALQNNPQHRRRVASDDAWLHGFVQELRRFYPFTPLLGAENCRELVWKDFRIPAGRLVVLDVYGIHRDERIWTNASRFDPQRFLGRTDDPFTLLQQGGGYHAAGHRCPGEWFTLEALKIVVRELAEMSWSTPTTDIDFNLRRIPSRLREPVTINFAQSASHILPDLDSVEVRRA